MKITMHYEIGVENLALYKTRRDKILYYSKIYSIIRSKNIIVCVIMVMVFQYKSFTPFTAILLNVHVMIVYKDKRYETNAILVK